MRSLSLSGDVAKETMKIRFIEEVTQKLSAGTKNEKDIKL